LAEAIIPYFHAESGYQTTVEPDPEEKGKKQLSLEEPMLQIIDAAFRYTKAFEIQLSFYLSSSLSSSLTSLQLEEQTSCIKRLEVE